MVFLPLIDTSQKFCRMLNEAGLRACEVNGTSADRGQVLADFEAGQYEVLCNSMLLTEGWDCPSVDCIVVLRPTKIRSLYCQMVGRGTRPAEGKKDLLLLDFLWHTSRHELCRPACLIAQTQEIADQMTANIAEAGCPVDLEAAEETAASDVVAQREEALAKQLAEMRKRKRRLVDPLQYEMSIQDMDLANYRPAFGAELNAPSDSQRKMLEKFGIFPDEIEHAGMAERLIDTLIRRKDEGLATPKQIRFLEGKGFRHVGTWQFEAARKLIDRIAAAGWHVPRGIDPATYTPPKEETDD